jgi:DNA end-binding protein Ku
VPVGLYSAAEDKTIHFNQLHSGTAERVKNKRVSSSTGEEIDYSKIVKGYDLGGGEYVVVTREEIESIEPSRSKTIEISDFVDLDRIDPVYYKSTYYLAPQGPTAEKPYALLLEAMRESNKIGVASFVFHSKQHLVAVRPGDGVLVLETMYYDDEIKDPRQLFGDLLGEEMSFSDREMAAAKLLVDSMAAEWDPSLYKDNYREKLLELIERKARGETITLEPVAEEKAPVVDLLAALEKSVEKAIEHRAETAASDAAAAAVDESNPARARAS